MKPPVANDPRIWFPAKRYGYGWGLPCRWQGWVVMGGYVALLALGAIVLIGPVHPLAFVEFALVLSGGLCVVCLKRGEPPRWRWGDEEEP